MAGPMTAEFRLVFKADGTAEITRATGDLQALERQAGQTGSAFSKIGARFIELNQGLELVRKAFGAVRSVIHDLIDPTLKVSEDLLQLSRRFGVPVEELALFNATARAFGVEIQDLSFGLR